MQINQCIQISGAFYAVNAKCPHLGLPMKKGAITVENGQPTITCNFHNSKFSLNDGACTAWYVYNLLLTIHLNV